MEGRREGLVSVPDPSIHITGCIAAQTSYGRGDQLWRQHYNGLLRCHRKFGLCVQISLEIGLLGTRFPRKVGLLGNSIA